MANFRMQERDLDLIILEELHADTGFAEWFAEKIGLSNARFLTADHSVSAKAGAKWGETDVLAFFEHGGEKIAALIEDKIAAAFQEKQAHRYHERATEILNEGIATKYITILIAPSLYLNNVPIDDPWDKTISIENIQEWFTKGNNSHARWRREAIGACLSRTHIQPLPGRENVIRFSAEFSAYLARHHGPMLKHTPGKDQSGPTIGYPGTSVNKMLWWKTSTAQMTLQLMGPYAGHVEHMQLPEGFDIEAASSTGRKCDYLFMRVPEIDFSTPLDLQKEAVDAAIAAAYRLISFLPEIKSRAAS